MVKRHKAWESFTRPLCGPCIRATTARYDAGYSVQGSGSHVEKYGIRYPVQAQPGENCTCPCHEVKNEVNDVPRENEVNG